MNVNNWSRKSYSFDKRSVRPSQIYKLKEKPLKERSKSTRNGSRQLPSTTRQGENSWSSLRTSYEKRMNKGKCK